ncbi:hypothetical protein [Lentibacillus salinarum]|uniref:Uncharacterized protein n=1 Tax=Lentibacillus salinarum TaxID=446820 RepID=A0ABW3ZWF5_9BACI
MEKFVKGHLVGFGSVRDMQHLEDDYYGEFTDAGMSSRRYTAFKDTPSKEECDWLCAELSGEVKVFKKHKELD